jgi:transposase
MAMVDRHGLPIAVCTESAQRAEVSLVQLLFDFMFIEVLPERLIGDRAYDSDKLDEELRERGVEMIAPNRCNRWQSQDRRPLRRYRRRWKVERFFGWLHNYRRLVSRWERKARNYQALVELACAIILLNALLR